ncbi:hypothetical protein DFS33DRAFT_1425208 [Desarmillaria ectypa]|nr:hypothetical protein DFS33DRAFT_1425208 [Desarmillaria ectypa]
MFLDVLPKSSDDAPVSGVAGVIYSLLVALEISIRRSAKYSASAADLLTTTSPIMRQIVLVLLDNGDVGSDLFAEGLSRVAEVFLHDTPLRGLIQLPSHLTALLDNINQVDKKFHGIKRYLRRKALRERIRQLQDDVCVMTRDFLVHITMEDHKPMSTSNRDRRQQISVETMTEYEYEEMSPNLNSRISEDVDEDPDFKPVYRPPTMFDEIHQVFWDCGK